MSYGLEFNSGVTEYSSQNNTPNPFAANINEWSVSYWTWSKGPVNFAESLKFTDNAGNTVISVEHVATSNQIRVVTWTDPTGECVSGFDAVSQTGAWRFHCVGSKDVLGFNRANQFSYFASLTSYLQEYTVDTGGAFGTSSTLRTAQGYWSLNYRGTWGGSNRLNAILGPVTFHGRALTMAQAAEVMANPFACPDPLQRVWLPDAAGDRSFIPDFSPHNDHISSRLRASSAVTLARRPQGIGVHNPFLPDAAKAELLAQQRGWGKYRLPIFTGDAVIITGSAAITLDDATLAGEGYRVRYLRPDADLAAGGWTKQDGSAVNIYQAIDEDTPDDADFARSGDTPSADILEVRLSDLSGTRVADTPVTMSVRYAKGVTGTINLLVRLKEGPTTRVTWTYNSISDTLFTAEEALTEPQATSITDWNNLSLEFEATSV